VGDDDDAAGTGRDPRLEPAQPLEVEIVRGLVEQGVTSNLDSSIPASATLASWPPDSVDTSCPPTAVPTRAPPAPDRCGRRDRPDQAVEPLQATRSDGRPVGPVTQPGGRRRQLGLGGRLPVRRSHESRTVSPRHLVLLGQVPHGRRRRVERDRSGVRDEDPASSCNSVDFPPRGTDHPDAALGPTVSDTPSRTVRPTRGRGSGSGPPGSWEPSVTANGASGATRHNGEDLRGRGRRNGTGLTRSQRTGHANACRGHPARPPCRPPFPAQSSTARCTRVGGRQRAGPLRACRSRRPHMAKTGSRPVGLAEGQPGLPVDLVLARLSSDLHGHLEEPQHSRRADRVGGEHAPRGVPRDVAVEAVAPDSVSFHPSPSSQKPRFSNHIGSYHLKGT